MEGGRRVALFLAPIMLLTLTPTRPPATDLGLLLAKHPNRVQRFELPFGAVALGVEGLERFVRGEPLRRVHECAFAVLALETEPVEPRL